MTATLNVTNTTSRTQIATARPVRVRAMVRKAIDATSDAVMENSYMFPQGGRETLSARSTTPAPSSNVASTLTE